MVLSPFLILYDVVKSISKRLVSYTTSSKLVFFFSFSLTKMDTSFSRNQKNLMIKFTLLMIFLLFLHAHNLETDKFGIT